MSAEERLGEKREKKKKKSSKTLAVFMFSLIDAFYKCSALANTFCCLPLTAKEKIPLKIPPLCSPHRVKAPNDLPPERRSDALFKDTLRIPSAFSASSVSERHLHIFTIKGRKCSCHSVPDELRDEWTGACFLATLSEESILFITAGWSWRRMADTYTDCTSQALNLGLLQQISWSSKTNKQMSKQNSLSLDIRPSIVFCLYRWFHQLFRLSGAGFFCLLNVTYISLVCENIALSWVFTHTGFWRGKCLLWGFFWLDGLPCWIYRRMYYKSLLFWPFLIKWESKARADLHRRLGVNDRQALAGKDCWDILSDKDIKVRQLI